MTDRCLIIATGPSLTQRDVTLARGLDRRTYAVNDAYRLAPWSDVVYACDEDWWNVHYAKVRRVAPGAELWTTSDEAAKKYNLNHIPGDHHDHARCRFDISGKRIIYGANGGFQTWNLAFADGMRDAVLLGFDMGHEPGTPTHFFGEHPPECNTPRPFNDWVDNFNRAAPIAAAAGMVTRNATRVTRLTCFERVVLEDLLA